MSYRIGWLGEEGEKIRSLERGCTGGLDGSGAGGGGGGKGTISGGGVPMHSQEGQGGIRGRQLKLRKCKPSNGL